MEVTPFDDAFGKLFADGMKWFDEQFPLHPEAPVKGLGPDPFGVAWTRRTEPSPLDALAVSALNARKLSAVIQVPDELLMAYGLIPDTRPKPPPPSWRTRLRWKIGRWRTRAARRAYKIIDGDWPDDEPEDW